MKNWIRIGGHYINLDQIIEIRTGEKRKNYDAQYVKSHEDAQGEWHEGGYPTEPCVIFCCVAADGSDGMVSAKEIVFFGKACDDILKWLANDVELEVTNLNFI